MLVELLFPNVDGNPLKILGGAIIFQTRLNYGCFTKTVGLLEGA